MGISNWGVRKTRNATGKERTEWTWFGGWLFIVVCSGMIFFPFNLFLMLLSSSGGNGWSSMNEVYFLLSVAITVILIVSGYIAYRKDST